ncbi:dihydrodipicolinate synthase family protein [Afifella pfennigii]|uniref:dihydrodipicolinate synthase family protein n=1 Tax=Afifella pfennigii TaxID=209897 RepID=UPI000A0763DC|nr:dihydrodipicolinate synthase family protein [Afifella pfennigii]
MSAAVCIGVDWGTTNLRAWAMDAKGRVLAQSASAEGLLNVRDRDFAGALARACGDWAERWPGVPVLLCGMVGSRQGWAEAVYLAGDVGPDELARATTAVPGARIVPGVASESWAGQPDVMRGEETQIVGALELGAGADAVVCLPGTHSKWVELRGGKIGACTTFLTGELFSRLCADSVLTGLIAAEAGATSEARAAAFQAGLDMAGTAALHHLIFSLRARALTGAGSGATAAELSGLLIGAELAEALPKLAGRSVTLVAAPDAAEHYASALSRHGIKASIIDIGAACRAGLLAIAGNVPEWRAAACPRPDVSLSGGMRQRSRWQAAMSRLSGVHAVLFALFDAHGRLDRGAMRAQVEYVREHGAGGMAVLGLATEVGKLSLRERLDVVEWAAEDRGALSLSVTITGNCLEEQHAVSRLAKVVGAELAILQPPLVGQYPAQEYLDFFARAGEGLDLELAIQNAPQYLGRSLSAADLRRLRQRLPRLGHVKAEVCAVDLAAFISEVGEDVTVLNGRGGLEMTDCLRAGARGFIVAPDVLPGAVRCWKAWQSGDEAAAEAAYAAFLPGAVFSMQSLEHLATYGKRVFAKRAGLTVHDRGPALRPQEFGASLARRWSRAG